MVNRRSTTATVHRAALEVPIGLAVSVDLDACASPSVTNNVAGHHSEGMHQLLADGVIARAGWAHVGLSIGFRQQSQ